MKIFHFSIFIFSFSLLAFNYGCEKADMQKPIVLDETQIEPRTTCNDCEDGDCCSAVMNLGTSFSLTFCGVYSTGMSTTPCSDNHFGNCPISGFEWTFTLGGFPAFEIFCVPQNSAFSVSSTGTGSVRITCQYGQIAPYSIDLYFPGTNYVYVDGDCIVSEHCPN